LRLAGVEVLEPASLRAMMRERARAVLDLHS
jgi:predicted DNA-binding transcriptional regulator YafY